MTAEEPKPLGAARAARDLVLVLGTLYLVKWLLLSIDALWVSAGPISLLASLAVALLCLRLGKEGWGGLGLTRPESIPKMLLWTVVILAVTMGVGIVVESAMSSLFDPAGESLPKVDERFENRFANLPGNVLIYLQWVAIAWIVGGFTEELLFRGFLISRFERLFSAAPFALLIAIVLQAVVFGHQHFYYQGMSGAFATGLIALVSGVFFVLLKRNIWPLILSHGLANTLGFTLIFLGVIPPP